MVTTDRSGAGLSVRVRITSAVALLVALALAGAGLLVYAIESRRLEARNISHVEQELDEFAIIQREGIDPETGRRPSSVGAVLELFLERNIPSSDELLVAWVGQGPVLRYPEGDDLYGEPAFLAAARPLVERGGSTRLATDRGEALVTAQPVRQGEQAGALVIVTYLDQDRGELRDTMRTYALVSGLSLLLITALAAWQSGRLLAPLRTLRETAEEIGATDLSRRIPATGNDDITALTRTVNRMLDRLEEAFVGQREFLDDVGHELRTPLTVLRGHLELVETCRAEDVAATRDLLLDEIDRMSRLVEDLILLAKSGRPDFVSRTPTDVATLTRTVLAKARGLGERHWVLDEATQVQAELDDQRLTQALLQLCDNAVAHTGPADEIGLGSSYTDGLLRLWVRDTGSGVAPADRARIFERFARGTRRPERESGFGLGLSIVRAIAEAHGGTVHVEDVVPRGARFVLTLPTETLPATVEEPVLWPAS